MDNNFFHLYKQFTGKSAHDVIGSRHLDPIFSFMADLMDESHIVVLNPLLEELKKSYEKGDISLPPKAFASKTMELSYQEFRNLKIDMRKRLDEYAKNWQSRLSESALLPSLESSGWIEEKVGFWKLAGKGTLAESRSFYQQTVQDVVSEGVRILALFDGKLVRTQGIIAKQWHSETVKDNFSKLLPLFEESMRFQEMELLKFIRNNIPKKFIQLFTKYVCNWENKHFSSKHELFRNALYRWYDPDCSHNGFEGFMFFVVSLLWEITNVKIYLFQKKWRIFLRGINYKEGNETITS